MDYRIFILIFFAVFNSCVSNINPEEIELLNGLYVNSSTKKLLDGKYESVWPIGGTYNGNHMSTFEYENGIPVNNWTYVFNGDPIHSGKYLGEDKIKSEIELITEAVRTDLNFWEEGGYWTLDTELIFPKKTDTISLKEVIKRVNTKLLNQYQYNSIDVYYINDSIKQKIYWQKIK